jgi:GAF domain-containing protein
MKRRSKAGGETIKSRRRKTPEPKPGNAPKGQARSKLSPATEETEVARLTRELTDERRQRVATSEVLRLLSGSHGDLNHLFDSILANATNLCQANFGTLSLYEGDAFRIVAMHNVPPNLAELRRREPLVRAGPLLRIAETKRLLHIADYTEYVASQPADSDAAAFAKLTGVRTILEVPMLKDDDLVGAVVIYRTEVRRFDDREIALIKDFAAQAVIAIENARLLNELRQRTTDLTSSLEQQTATSNVLEVISRSALDLQAVFDTVAESSVRLCGADRGFIFRFDGELLRMAASFNVSQELKEFAERNPLRPGRQSASARAALERRTVYILDCLADPEYTYGGKDKDIETVRTNLAVPIIKGDDLLGVTLIYRLEVAPFTDRQIALVETFADQAAIAIDNVKLLDQLRQRTRDLTEALEQQTATADVLKVISRSQFDLQLVLDNLINTATNLCGAKRGVIFRRDGDLYRAAAFYNATPELIEFVRSHPVAPGRHTITARVALERRVIHVADLQEDVEYTYALRDTELIRTELGVPMFRGEDLVGVFILYKLKVEPFADKQIELVATFADQAVIAIENVRLLNELRETTEEVEKLNQQLEQRVADQVGEIERMSRLRRFLPPQVADLIMASGSEKQLESHRREITALFCDLRGFTGFTESADAEDVMALLRDYHAAIGEIIIKYNGTLERYAGDGVMVVFNDPVPVENPALQAVLMALEVREAVGALTETWRRLGHDIGFGIGIAHGFATLGTIGFEGRFDYAAIGTVSNVASRLCDEAKPGQILISARVLMKVENAVRVEPVGEFELKGIRRPLAAYNVVGAASAQT